MSSPQPTTSQPGESGIPYSHREIFIAAPHAVGKGLDTHGEINNSTLQNMNTISEVLSTDDARKAIRDNDTVFEELLQSKYLAQAHASELASLYIERNSSNIGDPNSYENIDHLMTVETMSGWSKSDIQLFLGIKKAFTRGLIW